MTKEDEKVVDEVTLCTLKPEDYWEWRATMEEIDHAKTSHSLNTMKYKCMELQYRMLSMEMAMFRSKLSETAAFVDKCKKDYEPFKEKLEARYKVSLKDTTIREDFRVTKLPDIKEE